MTARSGAGLAVHEEAASGAPAERRRKRAILHTHTFANAVADMAQCEHALGDRTG